MTVADEALAKPTAGAPGNARVSRRAATWAWLWQRLTGVLLVVLLGVHFWVEHYAQPGAVLTFQNVQLRVQTLLFALIDSLLLAVAIFHGLNGVRMVVLDFRAGARIARPLTVGLWIVGLAALAFGIHTLLAFLGVIA